MCIRDRDAQSLKKLDAKWIGSCMTQVACSVTCLPIEWIEPMNVAEYVANRFAFLGVKQSFSVTGGGAMFLNDAFASCDAISTTYNHHEQACSMAAEGYARILNFPEWLWLLLDQEGSIL